MNLLINMIDLILGQNFQIIITLSLSFVILDNVIASINQCYNIVVVENKNKLTNRYFDYYYYFIVNKELFTD